MGAGIAGTGMGMGMGAGIAGMGGRADGAGIGGGAYDGDARAAAGGEPQLEPPKRPPVCCPAAEWAWSTRHRAINRELRFMALARVTQSPWCPSGGDRERFAPRDR